MERGLQELRSVGQGVIEDIEDYFGAFIGSHVSAVVATSHVVSAQWGNRRDGMSVNRHHGSLMFTATQWQSANMHIITFWHQLRQAQKPANSIRFVVFF